MTTNKSHGGSGKREALGVFLLALGLITFTVSTTGFFYNLRTTLSDYTWGDAPYQNQVVSNFLHHRPFQMSLYHNPGKGVTVNPLPYAHEASVHVNYAPFLFVPFYALHPTLTGLYAVVIVLNAFSFIFFGYRWLRLRNSDHLSFRTALLVFAVFCSSFLFIWQSKNHFILFLAPFVLLAHESLLTRRGWQFLLAMALWCSVSEDSCMFALSFAVYIFFYEKPLRSWAWGLLFFGFLYLVAASFVIQPAARWGMVVTQYNHSLSTLKISSLRLPTLISFLNCVLPVLFFWPAFSIIRLLHNPLAPPLPSRKAFGMLFIAPLASWAINVLNPAEQHFAPNMLCAFMAFLYYLSDFKIRPQGAISSHPYRLTGLILLFISLNLVVMRRNVPAYLKLAAKDYVAHKTSFDHSMIALKKEEAANRAVIAEVRKFPMDFTVVYWTNRNAEGFLTSRPNIWRFPEYYDVSDVLVIQPDAEHSWFDVHDDPLRTLPEILKEGTYHSSGENVSVDQHVLHRIVGDLVYNRKTHRILIDRPGLLVLERDNRYPFENPPETMKLGWVKNVVPVLKFYWATYYKEP